MAVQVAKQYKEHLLDPEPMTETTYVSIDIILNCQISIIRILKEWIICSAMVKGYTTLYPLIKFFLVKPFEEMFWLRMETLLALHIYL